MNQSKHILEQKHENSTHLEHSPLYMPDVTSQDKSLYQTVRGAVCKEVIQDEIIENIELIHENSKADTNNLQIPPKYSVIISNTFFFIQTSFEKLNGNINTLLSSFSFHYDYKERYSWNINYSDSQDYVSFNLRIYSTDIVEVFLFEFQFLEGDKMLYSELFNLLCQNESKLKLLCDENGNSIEIEEKEINSTIKEVKESPKLSDDYIRRCLKILQSPYYETVKEELKSLIFYCNSQENRILLSNSGIFGVISLLKGKDKEIDKFVSKIEELVISSCIECI